MLCALSYSCALITAVNSMLGEFGCICVKSTCLANHRMELFPNPHSGTDPYIRMSDAGACVGTSLCVVDALSLRCSLSSKRIYAVTD